MGPVLFLKALFFVMILYEAYKTREHMKQKVFALCGIDF